MSDAEDLLQAGFSAKTDELIPLLLHDQRTYGYISQENVRQITGPNKVSEELIYAAATFPITFRFEKPEA